MSTLVYIHGLNSSSQSDKFYVLKDMFKDDKVVAIDYDSSDLDNAIDSITYQIKNLESDDLVLVGSSLGGFFARYLADKLECKCILINPAIEAEQLHELDPNQKIFGSNKEYVLTKETIDNLVQFNSNTYPKNGVLLLLDQGDDLIDYRLAVNKYNMSAMIFTFSGGSHRFDHLEESRNEIERFIRRS